MTTVTATDNKIYIYYPICSSDVWLEIKLSDTIGVGGTKIITLDSQFLASTVIDVSHPLHVSIALTSAPSANPTIWVEKGLTSVTVHGPATATFDITISAKVLNREDISYQEEPMEFVYEGFVDITFDPYPWTMYVCEID